MTTRRPTFRSTTLKLDLLSLRLFLAVCDARHFGRAAEHEHIAASALSKRMQELEDLFGATLLYRNARRVTVTPMGQALERHARKLLGSIESMRAELSEFTEGVRGHVRIHANASVIVAFLAADLRRFLTTHTGVQIDLQECLSREAIHAVSSGEADLGFFAAGPEHAVGLEVHGYRRDRLVAVLPSEHPLSSRSQLSFDELLSCDLIGVREASAIMDVMAEQAEARGRAIQFKYRATTNEVARSLVAAGLGATLQPEGMARAVEARLPLRTVPIDEPWAQRELRVCFKRPDTLSVPTRVLIEFLLGGPLPAATA